MTWYHLLSLVNQKIKNVYSITCESIFFSLPTPGRGLWIKNWISESTWDSNIPSCCNFGNIETFTRKRSFLPMVWHLCSSKAAALASWKMALMNSTHPPMMKPMQYLKQADIWYHSIRIYFYLSPRDSDFSTIPIPYAWMALSVGCLRVDAVCCDSSSLPYKMFELQIWITRKPKETKQLFSAFRWHLLALSIPISLP